MKPTLLLYEYKHSMKPSSWRQNGERSMKGSQVGKNYRHFKTTNFKKKLSHDEF